MLKIDQLFLICISVRVAIAIFAYFLLRWSREDGKEWIRWLVGAIALAVSVAFLSRFFLYREGERGAFKTLVWWNKMRLVHSVIIGLFAIHVLFDVLGKNKRQFSAVLLVLDVVIGALVFYYRKAYNIM